MPQPVAELIQGCIFATGQYFNPAVTKVQGRTLKAKPQRLAAGCRTKAHALHPAGNEVAPTSHDVLRNPRAVCGN